ncbi:MAG: hypothetical protein MUD08_19090 [Cytophagales bacterium]|nr:hypothetical protein [Cytophagales bacterium]
MSRDILVFEIIVLTCVGGVYNAKMANSFHKRAESVEHGTEIKGQKHEAFWANFAQNATAHCLNFVTIGLKSITESIAIPLALQYVNAKRPACRHICI